MDKIAVDDQTAHRACPTVPNPIGATGVSMHVLTAMQVRGDAEGMQVEGARLGGVYNMGGACVASYISILEPLR